MVPWRLSRFATCVVFLIFFRGVFVPQEQNKNVKGHMIYRSNRGNYFLCNYLRVTITINRPIFRNLFPYPCAPLNRYTRLYQDRIPSLKRPLNRRAMTSFGVYLRRIYFLNIRKTNQYSGVDVFINLCRVGVWPRFFPRRFTNVKGRARSTSTTNRYNELNRSVVNYANGMMTS